MAKVLVIKTFITFLRTQVHIASVNLIKMNEHCLLHLLFYAIPVWGRIIQVSYEI